MFNHLKDDIGLSTIDQDKYVYKYTPIEGKSPIYVGLYVNNLIDYSSSDTVEEWFENNLKLHLKVDFMGNGSWFLEQRQKWHNDKQGRVLCHISQQAMLEGILEKHNYSHYKGSRIPYQSGLKINRIEHDNVDPS